VPAAAPVSDDALTAEVVETVSRHTGYPVDFIELDQDLEGELGIDTVKQAEIMAELRETYSLPVDESFQLRDHPTLNHMIAYIQRMGDGDTPDSPPSEPTSPADPSPAQPSAEAAPVEGEPDEGVVATIIEIVVRHTGYPADFLELDQDLEGELGIDTVKQAEIMGDCRDAFEIPVDESFQLRDHPTLNHMIAYIQGMKGTSGSGTAPDSPPAPSAEEEAEDEPAQEEVLSQPAAQEPAAESTVRRWQVEVEEAEAGEPDPVFLKGSHVLITDDNWGVSEALSHKLEAAGVEAVRLMLDPSIVSKIKVEHEAGVDIIRLNPGNEQQLGQLQEHLGDIDVSGVIHLAPLTLTGMAWAEVTNQAQTTMVAHGFFGILQAVDAHLGVRASGIICSVSALDGRHGNGGKRFNPLGASAHGIVKSYARERERLRCRALDVAPEQLTDPAALAQCILDELEQPGPVEVSIDADGRRWQMCLYDEQLEAEPTRLASDDVWVVSGGGSGVTAACIVGLAEANPDVGVHFALLGRTKLDHGVADLLSADEQTLEARKLAVRERMQRESDGGMVTIVEWEREWSKVTRSLDILRTLEAIEASGNHATYHPCNVIRPKQVNRVFSELSDEVGPVTGIVHGAGMEDSKLLGDKGFEMFAKVMAVKVSGWLTLANAALDHDANLRFVCCFTSIAGRFGNAGQVDYAAANCVLDAEMCRLAVSEDEPRAVAIAWSGWRDVGMATRGSIETVFETAGIETIPVEKGVELFVDEVMCGGRRMVVIAGRLGVLDESESTREPPQRLAPDVAGLLAEPARFPFIDRIVEHDPYETLVSECTLDVQQFPFLSDHAIDGTPYLPGVMALEMFAEAAQLLWPACSLSGFDDVSFGLPVKLVRQEQKVRTLARFSRQDDAHVWVECTLESDLVNKAGEVFGEPRQHHAGTVRLLKHGAQKPVPLIPAVGLPERGPATLPTSFIYERFFHGPRFQVHGGIIAGSSVNGDVACDGIALMRSELPNGIQFADEPVLLEALPMLIEVGFQNAGMVAMEIDGLQSLPIGIEQVELLQTPKAGGLRVRSVRRAAESDGVTLHDVLIVDANDHPVLALNGVRLKGMAPVEPGMEFKLKRN
jgi:NAD(P)-dependent dehydrogenase (short-subunit alcohol dehydrogenase family)/acyl carrier protein